MILISQHFMSANKGEKDHFQYMMMELPCPRSGAGSYIASVSYPARAAGQGLILLQFLSSFFFFFFLLTLPAQRGRVLYCISFFLLLLSSSFFFYLSTCQYIRHPRSDYAHTWSK